MRRIKLTQGKWATVDDEDYERLSKYAWHVEKSGYAARVAKKSDGKKGMVYMQQDILRVPPNTWIGRVRNDRRRNNRKSNLRVSNASFSQANRLRQKNNTTGFKGVEKLKVKWRAQIVVNYRKLHLTSPRRLYQCVSWISGFRHWLSEVGEQQLPVLVVGTPVSCAA